MSNIPGTKRLYDNQQGRCYYCKRKMFPLWGQFFNRIRKQNDRTIQKFFTVWSGDPLKPTFDHIILKSDGGSNAITNGVCACSECNRRRGSLPFNDWKLLVTCEQDLINMRKLQLQEIKNPSKTELKLRKIQRERDKERTITEKLKNKQKGKSKQQKHAKLMAEHAKKRELKAIRRATHERKVAKKQRRKQRLAERMVLTSTEIVV